MDTSKEYIKMCKMAKEIQGFTNVARLELAGDFCTGTNKQGDFFNGITWLPKQDQLQEMYSDFIRRELGVIHSEIKQAFLDFSHWLNQQYLPKKFTCVPTNCFDSGEKLWLAFIMQEQFNKVWNDKEWVVKKSILPTKE